MSAQVDRLRQHPSERFDHPERKLDLDTCYRELLAEPHDGTDGHRQIAVARQGHLTLILFHFEPQGLMPEHVVDGAVTIHVLDGQLEVRTENDLYRVESGQLLFLAPQVVHDVRATEETKMLLTVHLTPDGEHRRGNGEALTT